MKCTSDGILTKDRIAKFWDENDAELVGDTSSPEIIKLSKNHIQGKVLDVGADSGALIRLISNAIGLDLVFKHGRTINGEISNVPFRTV